MKPGSELAGTLGGDGVGARVQPACEEAVCTTAWWGPRGMQVLSSAQAPRWAAQCWANKHALHAGG